MIHDLMILMVQLDMKRLQHELIFSLHLWNTNQNISFYFLLSSHNPLLWSKEIPEEDVDVTWCHMMSPGVTLNWERHTSQNPRASFSSWGAQLNSAWSRLRRSDGWWRFIHRLLLFTGSACHMTSFNAAAVPDAAASLLVNQAPKTLTPNKIMWGRSQMKKSIISQAWT